MRKDIKIKSEVTNLRIVEKLIDDISLELDLSDEIYGNILVATMEATNNAIVHGNNANPDKEVSVFVEKSDNEIKIGIQDQGEGFDYAKVPDPTAPENLEKINGRGVFLMKRLSDSIEFEDSGRLVQLKFKL